MRLPVPKALGFRWHRNLRRRCGVLLPSRRVERALADQFALGVEIILRDRPYASAQSIA